MSVTSFPDPGRLRDFQKRATANRDTRGSDPDALPEGRLTTKQFNRHLAHVLEDQTRLAIAKYVGDVEPVEVLDLARRVANLRARYVATALAAGGASAPPTKAEVEEMRFMRDRIEELEHALSTVREAIAGEVIQVRNVITD